MIIEDMGKFQSKIASKRRQSPEGNVVNPTHGGSLACTAQTCQKELKLIHKHKLTENLCVELRENRLDQNCNCSVLPPRNTDKSIYIQINKQIKKKQKGHAGSQQDTACVLVPNEDSQQQWVFTLCNDSRGKVTKEDMFSLIQSMYEVIEASVTQPGRTPLRIRLAVTPTASPDKVPHTAEREQRAGNPDRKLYCEDENIERRNHYLDLAGIENYASKFDSAESPSQEPTLSAVQHRIVAERGNCRSNEPPRGAPVPHSLKTKSASARNDRNREGKPYKHPASWCHLSPSHPPTQSVLHRSHSRRLHCRVQDAGSHLRPTPGGDREILSGLPPCCGVPLVQKHEHHHHHDHHHHHHHHYPPS